MTRPEQAIRPGHIPPDALVRFVDLTTDYAIFFLDKDGNVASWNEGAQRMMGYTDKEILGKHVSRFFLPADVAAKKPQQDLRAATAEGRFESEGWRLRKDGSMFWASVSTMAIKEADGTLQGFAKITRDLTDRRHQEEALRASEERFRLLTQSVRDYAIYMLDPTGHVMSWNEGAQRIKGYTEEEIVGQHFSKFYTTPDVEAGHPQHNLEEALREGRYEEEGWRLRKDGSRFWANVTITTLHDAHGRHVGFAKVTRDLTAKRKVEEELRDRAVSYAKLNRELDAFSHTVAHDLRSPIRAVEHLSSVLLEDESSRLSADGVRTLQALHTSAVNMARLVQALLDLSTAGGRAPSRSRIDITSMAREIAGTLEEPGRAIEFHVEEGLAAEADPYLMRIALTNLLSNAVKFTRHKPHAVVTVGKTRTDHGPAFFVRDNGVGFETTRQAQLFQPFVRLHATNEFEGTGIGLATVQRIVQGHGGRTWAESKPGDGATFYFTIP